MAVSMKFTPTPEKKKLRTDINENVFQELERYLACAQEEYPWLQLDMVVEQLLDDAMKKDRNFRSWLKKQRKTQGGETAPATPAPDDDNGDVPTPDHQPTMLAMAENGHDGAGNHG